ncbi:DUF3786 domain-containing protein [Chloroflexota bacterium]
MSKPNQSDLDRFAWRIDELRQEVSRRDPFTLRDNTDTVYEDRGDNQGVFKFPFWESNVLLTYPDLIAYNDPTGEELPLFHQAMLLYYFRSADGCPVSEQWISFSELPDGRFYNQAFQGYTGLELARSFRDDHTMFERAAKSLNGTPHSIGDLSFSFMALPRVSLLVVFWQGDEDFSSSYKLLFDSSAPHYLPTDGYAILGSTLTRQLIQAAGS